MRLKKFFAGVVALAASALLSAPGAMAATPKQVYADYADNARLDRSYSAADLERALEDTWVQGYGHPAVLVGLKPAVHTQVRSQKRTSARGVAGAQVTRGARAVTAQRTQRTLPFTGVDLALLAGGGAFLLLVGGSLRRLSRSNA